MQNVKRLYTRQDIHTFILGVWKTDLFRSLHKEGLNEALRHNIDGGEHNFVSKIVEDFAALPRFVFDMSDPKTEWAHFSTWWGGIPTRSYDNPYIHDLYWIHEMAHAGNMVFMPGMNLENFGRKMTDNELHASVVSEVQVYFEIPELRDLSFSHLIYADRFLRDKDFVARYKADPRMGFEEMKVQRRNTMMDSTTSNVADIWINRFYMQNAAWVACWAHSYDKIETAMAILRDGSRSKGDIPETYMRKQSLNTFIDTFLFDHSRHNEALSFDTNIPFAREAQAFAGVYWANRGHYDDAMKWKQLQIKR